jgi:hypothetical protein
MRPTVLQIVLWYSVLSLESVVCVLAFWRRLYQRLPVFTSYLTVLMVREVFVYCLYRTAGYNSKWAFYSYWATQALLLAGRGASIGELAWRASRNYPGFRVVLKWALISVALVLLLRAGWVGEENAAAIPQFVLSLERQLELTAATMLFALFLLSSRYEVPFQFPERLVALGLFEYSLVQIVNNAVSRQFLESYFRWGDIIRVASFQVALVIWFLALAKRLPPIETVQAPTDLEAIRDFVGQGEVMIRKLADRLRDFRKGNVK